MAGQSLDVIRAEQFGEGFHFFLLRGRIQAPFVDGLDDFLVLDRVLPCDVRKIPGFQGDTHRCLAGAVLAMTNGAVLFKQSLAVSRLAGDGRHNQAGNENKYFGVCVHVFHGLIGLITVRRAC